MRDLVCGKTLEAGESNVRGFYAGCVYYFCSQDCVKKFDAAPREYLSESAKGA